MEANHDPSVSGDVGDAQGFDMTWAGQLSFGRLPATRDLTGVDIAVVGIPYDNAVTN